jgi:hypothetical protein
MSAAYKDECQTKARPIGGGAIASVTISQVADRGASPHRKRLLLRGTNKAGPYSKFGSTECVIVGEDDYLGHAQECLARSRQSASNEDREVWVSVALEWIKLAHEMSLIKRLSYPDWSCARH